MARSDPLGALFDGARRGDDRALRELYAQMWPRLYAAAFGILHDADDAADVAQSALLRALARPALFLGTGSVAGWMTRIATNLAKNVVRDARLRRGLLEAASPDEKSVRGAEPSPAPDPERLAADNQTRSRLRAVIATLPERQRQVVMLHVVAQLDFADVAARLAMTELNARVTFWQAKKKLLEALTR